MTPYGVVSQLLVLVQQLAEVLVHAHAMKFQSLDLEVSASVSQAKQAFEA